MLWAEREQLDDYFEPEERAFLNRAGASARFKYQIEAIYALNWAIGREAHLAWLSSADNDFVHRLPNLKKAVNSQSLRHSARMRTDVEVLAAADLAYCLHWIVRDSELHQARPPLVVEPYIIEERRRALDWLIGEDDWYAITLDT